MTAAKGRARIILSINQVSQIKRRVLGDCGGQPSRAGYVCSEPWANHCVHAIEAGTVPPRKRLQKLERDLRRYGVYPPGGECSIMVETFYMRYVPPDYTGSPIGEREDALTLRESCLLPGSCSAHELEKIRMRKAKPGR